MSNRTGGESPKSLGAIRRVPFLADGYAALDRGDWEGARTFFSDANAKERTPEALEGLGLAAWLLHDEGVVFEAREAAYDLFRRRGDRLGSGRMAIWLATDSLTFRGESSVANGWLRRARSCLDGFPIEAEHGWLALIEADMALMLKNDSDAAQRAGMANMHSTQNDFTKFMRESNLEKPKTMLCG